MKQTRTRSIFKLFSIGLVLFAAGFAVLFIIREDFLGQLANIRFEVLPLLKSFIISYIGVILLAVPAWRSILAAHGVSLPFTDDVRIYCYSALGSTLPGRIWTLVGRTAFYKQCNVNGVTVAVAGIVEMVVIGVSAMVLYVGITMLNPKISLWKTPIFGIVFSLLALVLIHPKIFQRFVNWLLKTVNLEFASVRMQFDVSNLLRWVLIELVVIIIGGSAVFSLLRSLFPVSSQLYIPIVASWAASVAAGTLFFWMPGTPLIRDGVMALALTPYLSPTNTIMFVVLVRIWIIISLFLLAGLIWFLLEKKAYLFRVG